jgi:hypothetical protein
VPQRGRPRFPVCSGEAHRAFIIRTIKGVTMEFVQLVLALAAILLVMFKPARENWAFCLMWIGWLFMIYLYVGHVSGNILGLINL